METLACIRWDQGKPGADIFFHSLFNRPDVPQPVMEHVLRHEGTSKNPASPRLLESNPLLSLTSLASRGRPKVIFRGALQSISPLLMI